MSPRARKPLDPKSRKFEVRFAVRLRAVLDEQEMDAVDLADRLQRAGVEVTSEAVKKWLRAERLPHPSDAETIGRILGLKDYRKLWPPPM
jgi:hypothetical protein